MAKWYVEKYPSGNATYGKRYSVCMLDFKTCMGIKTTDRHDDCVDAATQEILKKDLGAIIKYISV